MEHERPRTPRLKERFQWRAEGGDAPPVAPPSARGWAVSLLGCTALAVLVPCADNFLNSTRLSLNLLPASSILLTLAAVLAFNFGIARWREKLALTRQDLVLLFCTTMLVNPLPSLGFLGYLSSAQMGPQYYATPENEVERLLHPHLPESLAARDPRRLESVEACAAEDVGGTYNPAGGATGTGCLEGAPPAVDGVPLLPGARLLLMGQAEPRQNGFYVVEETGRWARAPDADASWKVNWGLYAEVKGGGARKGRMYFLASPPPVELNETPLRFEEVRDEALLPRPNAWFYEGLPKGGRIPWTLLIAPFARWALALTLILVMFFALSALLHRQWSDVEKLPFPLMQAPEQMLEGLFSRGEKRPVLREPLLWWGAALVFLLHGYNALGDYLPDWAPIPLRIIHLDWTYMTERPFRHLWPTRFNIFPSVIGIMFLISLEVSFSLWFFFVVVFKAGVLVAVLYFALGWDGWHFVNQTEGPRSIFAAQGTGACLALVAVGFYMARRQFRDSLRRALGAIPVEAGPQGLSPRALWTMLLAAFAGSVVWLVWAGVSWHWAAAAVLLLLWSATGVTRLVSESGVFFLQMSAHPAQLLSAAFSPVALGAGNFVLLNVWSRAFVFDWYRSCPMINVAGALHLGARAGLRLRSLLWGMAAALLIVFTVGFGVFYYGAYTTAGGARTFGWPFAGHPQSESAAVAFKAKQLESYQQRSAAAEAQGRPLTAPPPRIARADRAYLTWLAVGALVLALFLFLRSRLFWWPHPIGFVMWMGLWPLVQMWFSYFLGWLVKLLIVKFGGQREYLRWRPFFVGIIVGEALATLFWLAVAALCGRTGGYNMEFN